MGLDITMYKVIKDNSYNDDTSYYFFADNDEEGIKWMNTFKPTFDDNVFHKTQEEYMDFDKVGFTDDTCHILCCNYCEKSYYQYIKKDHELYKLYYNIINTDNRADYKLTDDDIALLQKYEYIVDPEVTIYMVVHFIQNIASEYLYLDDVPTYMQDGYKLYKEEVGYQRKGMNNAFYEDHDCNFTVFDKKRLEEIYEKYVKDDCKEYFKRVILDPFVEGEHFVNFDW